MSELDIALKFVLRSLQDLGLGMAKAHGFPVADNFLRACGELAHVKLYASTIEGDWEQHLGALLDVKRQILGQRPGED